MDIHSIRKEYVTGQLIENQVDADPINQFKIWFENALNAKVNEPNAMVLSTVDNNAKPHARIVLLKDFDHEGFVFFTNYDSNKGIELSANPSAALLFFWPELERQVRIEGSVKKVSRETTIQYFNSRPLGSRLGALASPQSKYIPDRKVIEDNLHALEKEYENREVPVPDHWGGYVLRPEFIEFWQGRPNRLHDRILYTKNENKPWDIIRLAP